MPNEPCLSELPDFVPAGIPGTADYGKAAAGAIARANPDAVRDVVNAIARLAHQQHTTQPDAVPEKAAVNHA